jgi:hypothetical protein
MLTTATQDAAIQAERAYRRGVHQVLSEAYEWVRGSPSLSEAIRRLGRAADEAGRFRNELADEMTAGPLMGAIEDAAFKRR